MKDVYSPPRTHPHTPGEVAQFHATRDHEAAGIRALVLGAIHTIGVSGRWLEALKIVVPVALDVGAVLVKATHEESPGGSTITHDELVALARGAGREIEKALLRELAHLVTDDASGFVSADAAPGSIPVGPVPTLDPAELAGKTATITQIAPTTLPPDSATATPVQPATAVPPSAPAVPPIPAPPAPAPAPAGDPLKAA